MTRYIVQRLLLLPFLLLAYSFVIFVIMQAPPGDFLTTYVATLSASGSSISGEQIAKMRVAESGTMLLQRLPRSALGESGCLCHSLQL